MEVSIFVEDWDLLVWLAVLFKAYHVKRVKQLLTESDNETHDIFRWLSLASVAVAIGLSIYSVVQGGLFDAQSYGIGLGGLLAGTGVAIGLKK